MEKIYCSFSPFTKWLIYFWLVTVLLVVGMTVGYVNHSGMPMLFLVKYLGNK